MISALPMGTYNVYPIQYLPTAPKLSHIATMIFKETVNTFSLLRVTLLSSL